MREKTVTPVHDTFHRDTLDKYAGVVKHLRRKFEALRDENHLDKRQTQGDEVDLDALIEALADAKDGREMSDRLFVRLHRAERNIAVAFLVDMSGSTKGWINEAEREALVLLCEALELLGDRYAIYGFSGTTRKRCELFRIKTFDEPYGDEVKARIAGIRPQEYTRMGFALRHMMKLLNQVEAKTRVLITLSDGRPDDYFDVYRGQYGIEDTRMALLEAARTGIHPFCVTLDRDARDYLPHMYGAARYIILDDVRQLPVKVTDIYRRITT
jgi:nitric oxide reductase NorD protein